MIAIIQMISTGIHRIKVLVEGMIIRSQGEILKHHVTRIRIGHLGIDHMVVTIDIVAVTTRKVKDLFAIIHHRNGRGTLIPDEIRVDFVRRDVDVT